jgi:hypothetical protein
MSDPTNRETKKLPRGSFSGDFSFSFSSSSSLMHIDSLSEGGLSGSVF